MKFRTFLCILIFQELGFANRSTSDLLTDRQTIYIRDWKVRLVNSEQYPLNHSIFRANDETPTLSDTDVHREISPSAGRITLEKVLEETGGAMVGGVLLTYLTYEITNNPYWAYGIGATIGPSVGATLVGNRVMEPNGSYYGSLVGSTIGASLGGAVALVIWYGTALASIMNPTTDTSVDSWVLVPAISFPVMGAVTGYNWGYEELGKNSLRFHMTDNYYTASGNAKEVSISVELVSLKF